jgi:2-polyprenyl-3-methyl-5-hydroxy-6-metoxy-1,4-benzoquinol methylase
VSSRSPTDLEAVARAWDAEAAAFDEEPDHGLRDPETRAAWRSLLAGHLPPAPARVADLGCGTGSLSLLLAEQGYDVHGVDVSGAMVRAAREKAARSTASPMFVQGDAGAPDLEPGSVDVVLCRHVLWALPDPEAVLARWVRLLSPGGTLVLVEGRWSTGAGLTADDCARLVRTQRGEATVHHLPEPVLWGGPIEDERFLLVSPR